MYMVEEIREEFLNKQLNKLCSDESSSLTIQEEEFADNAPVIYRPHQTMVDENFNAISW